MITGNEIREYLISNSPWLDPERTVDRILYGDGDKPASHAGVCWYPSIETLRAAHDAGCGIVVTHEPLFWRHVEPDPEWYDRHPGRVKKAFLDETGLCVVRAHDSWDQWPGIGIRDAWAGFLGLGNPVAVSGDLPQVCAVYAIEPRPLRAFAADVAAKVRALGEDSVRVTGDPDRLVSRPAVGVGCFTPDMEMLEKGADVLLVCYDGASYWQTRERLHEAGAAVVALEHGTTEMPGLEALCRHLQERFDTAQFSYFAEHVRPWTAHAENGAP